MRVLITGASGFVGRHATPRLADEHSVVAAVRRPGSSLAAEREVVVGDITRDTDWSSALDAVDTVVHLAARVHVMKEHESDSLRAYRELNTHATTALAEQSASAGVRRFVLLSSIKVNGEATRGSAYTAADSPWPVDPYGVSKWEAEQSVRSVSMRTGMEAIVLRSPVIYGVGVGGNIRRIARAVQRGIPLPFGSIRNRRTMIAVENLLIGMRAAIGVESAPEHPVLIGDTAPVSTADLVRYLARGMGVPARLWPCPAGVLRGVASVAGRREEALRLTQDLEIDANWGDLGVAPGDLVAPDIALGRLGSLIAEADR